MVDDLSHRDAGRGHIKDQWPWVRWHADRDRVRPDHCVPAPIWVHDRFTCRKRNADLASRGYVTHVPGQRTEVITRSDGGTGDSRAFRAFAYCPQRFPCHDRSETIRSVHQKEGVSMPTVFSSGYGIGDAVADPFDEPRKAQEAVRWESALLGIDQEFGLHLRGRFRDPHLHKRPNSDGNRLF
jgi:hypothetical protein